VGAAIAKGYYTITNISKAEALEIITPGEYSCSPNPDILSYLFQPASSDAQGKLVGACLGACYDTSNRAVGDIRVQGYWVGANLSDHSQPFFGATFRAFEPGMYTVIGGDEWGSVVLSYFEVIAG
jgi:hypothetical protein